MKFELLPNEIFIECFQYLNASDIFHSFDGLNYRFYSLIRHIPLHLNFHQLKKFQFKKFCQIVLSNPKIKQNILSLQISDEDTYEQIPSFLSLFSLNEFIHLRSLSFIKINRDNAEQVLPMLPFLSGLDYFSCVCVGNGGLEIIPALSKSKIRILTIPNIYFKSAVIYEIISLTSLTISVCDIPELCQLFKYTPMLNYVKLNHLYGWQIEDNELKLINTNAVHLKQLIVDDSHAHFKFLELFLKHIPNLEIFSISAWNQKELIDANRWQHLIESSLPHLHVFKFYFIRYFKRHYHKTLNRMRQFQTDLWYKQHHWYTNCEIVDFTISIYTIPHIQNQYTLTSTAKRHRNSLISYSNEFDNVKNLSLSTKAIRKDPPCIFRNVQSLRLMAERKDNANRDEIVTCNLKVKQIEYLSRMLNVSSIKHLTISEEYFMSSSILLEILKNFPNISSLTTDQKLLLSFLKNRQLCTYLNKKIIKLHISFCPPDGYVQFNEIDLFCKVFSNLEHLQCYFQDLDDLYLILTNCSKLSMIKLERINEEIYSWIQIHKSTLNVYFDFFFPHSK
jgi:hypothetical protein